MDQSQKRTDKFLILQFKEGNTSVIADLVKRYHKLFLGKAYWITRDKEMAKDVAQDCWIIIMKKLQDLNKVDSFKSWALRIVYTKAVDAVKIRNKARLAERNENIVNEVYSSEIDRHSSQQQNLLEAIRKLPKEKQAIIRLFYAEAYSINQISKFLRIPKGTVKSRLFKAREKLKSSIKNGNHEK